MFDQHIEKEVHFHIENDFVAPIIITPDNQPFTIKQNTRFTLPIEVNNTENAELTYDAFSHQGSATVDDNGVLSFTPNSGFTGTAWVAFNARGDDAGAWTSIIFDVVADDAATTTDTAEE